MRMDNKYTFDKPLFASRIKQARKNRDLTQEALASLLNINVNTLAKCESPKNKLTFSYTNLIELVNVLDIDVNYLFRVDGGTAPQSQSADELHALVDGLTEREQSIVFSLVKALTDNREKQTNS
jgi:transcriptional regulator with XRE-family HTH domain